MNVSLGVSSVLLDSLSGCDGCVISELFLIRSTVLETILGFDLKVDLLKSLSDIEETDSFLSLSDTRMYI